MKMGKSLGNTLEPKNLVDRFGADSVRYFFLREAEFGNDGDYSEDRFINIVNAHLANTIGNLLNCTLGLLKKNCQSMLAFDSSIAAEGHPFKDTVEKLDLVIILEAIRIIAIALRPITPSLCLRIYMQLGFSKDQFEAVTWSDTKWGGMKAGQIMADAKPVFARIENRKEGEDEVVLKVVKDKKKTSRSQGLVQA